MKRVEAYHILAKMWETATPEQAEAIGIAQNDIEFVDLVSENMVPAVRCGECIFCKEHPTSDAVKLCTHEEWNTEYSPLVSDNDFCSRGERRSDNATD